MNSVNHIFKYYKQKYHLDTKLDLDNKEDNNLASFNVNNNIIRIKARAIKKACQSGQSVYFPGFDNYVDNYKKAIILNLLHEIKHAIDYKNNNRVILEVLFAHPVDYKQNHNKFKAERMADNFSLREYKKWNKENALSLF